MTDVQPVRGLGHIFFWYDNWRLAARVRSRMVANGFVECPLDDDRVHCFLCDDLETCLPILSNFLTEREKRQISVLASETTRPNIFEFGRLKTIAQHETQLLALWLGDMLMDRRYRSLMQPIVHASNQHDIMGYEFLIRGLHTDGTDIPAPTLFGTAESCDMLYALDMAAGESATRTARLHDIQEDVFVNVLPRTIGDEAGLDAWLQAVLAAAEVSPEQIVFELVESQQLGDASALKNLVEKLHHQGIRVALDDFGSGFNNLVGLVEVAPDYIKIDKSLIDDLSKDDRKGNLVASLVDSAKSSDIEVIAEGVEDAETAEKLVSIGVDYLQGYHIGFPKDQPVTRAPIAV
ncbi:MAG: EAL domain-containing protein [Kordiimonadaceae bacterium]|nr:EAL domain-containing protein [Kordiimonadaceae bacterium]MBO6570030.1 EAL domain-containing protein [Kordiimonadaceae bacterium]MBO6965873.1 EAL domain-containing protein [Kordiimonadaceae bacterium]